MRPDDKCARCGHAREKHVPYGQVKCSFTGSAYLGCYCPGFVEPERKDKSDE